MSLLDGRHSVKVETARPTKDAYNGTKLAYGLPRTVRCSVQPLRAEEATAIGLQADTAYKVVARSWPGGPYTRVTWSGRTWFQHGETLHHSMSPRTAHDTAVIVVQTAKVV